MMDGYLSGTCVLGDCDPPSTNTALATGREGCFLLASHLLGVGCRQLGPGSFPEGMHLRVAAAGVHLSLIFE